MTDKKNQYGPATTCLSIDASLQDPKQVLLWTNVK